MPQTVYPNTYAYAEPQKQNNGLTIGGLVLSICSLVLCCIPFLNVILAGVGLVLAILGLQKNRSTMATVAIVLSAIGAVIGISCTVTSLLNVGDIMDGIMKEFPDEFSGFDWSGFEEEFGNAAARIAHLFRR